MLDEPICRDARGRNLHVAVTGATGFIGTILLVHLAHAGHIVTALARPRPGRSLPIIPGVCWVSGELGQEDLDARLVNGADAVIHLAGLTKARSNDAFHAVNAVGAGRLAAAARVAGVSHFIHISSLAATQPSLSDYARSKHLGELAVRKMAGSMPVTIIRAPAVFGHNDPATAPLFRAMRLGVLPVPGGRAGRAARFSLIYVDDLGRYIVEALTGPRNDEILEPYGEKSLGWRDLADVVGPILGRRPMVISVPPMVLKGMAGITSLSARLTGLNHQFSVGKVCEILHPAWIGRHAIASPTPLSVAMAKSLGLSSGVR